MPEIVQTDAVGRKVAGKRNIVTAISDGHRPYYGPVLQSAESIIVIKHNMLALKPHDI